MTIRPIRSVLRILLLLPLLFPLTAVEAQTLPPDDVVHVTVTSEELAGEFARLAALRESEGMTARVVTLAWIADHVPAGVDDAETLRNFAVAAHAEWGLQFLLLGGDASIVPVRTVWNEFYPPGSGTEIPVDLYYGGLEGDWNADGDDLWGEPWLGEDEPGDAADLEADIAVGRAPVTTVAEAARFVDGVVAADAGAAQQIAEFLMMAEVLFPTSWQPGDPIHVDGADFAIELEDRMMQAPSPPTVTRMFESGTHPHDLPLDRAHALSALDSGRFGMVMAITHGWFDQISVGSELLSGTDLLDLGNAPDYFVMTGWGPANASFEPEAFFRSALAVPEGGAVGCVGWTVASFPSVAFDSCERLLERLYLGEPRRLGPAVDHARMLEPELLELNTVWRWNAMALALLGDPALRMGPVPDWDATTAAPVPAAGLRLSPPAPNPFNPTTVLRFELLRAGHAELAIYALDGRLVDVLVDGQVRAGRHEVFWRGTDARGRALPSGSYLARLRSDGQTAVQRLQLVR
ncbi:hypothetical protein GF314_17760 [bacterium]|nr:hypothetical protein [bacterium]